MIKNKKMKLEEAVEYIRMILRQKDLPDAAKSLEYVYAVESIETILQSLENSNIKDVGNITATQYVKIQREGYLRGRKEEQEKARECIFRLQENSIPKKKIEGYLAEETEKYKVYKKEVDKNENLRPQLWNHLGRKNMCEKILDIEKKVTLD